MDSSSVSPFRVKAVQVASSCQRPSSLQLLISSARLSHRAGLSLPERSVTSGDRRSASVARVSVSDCAPSASGKELEIRKALSPSHLYSSAFVVLKENGKFVLVGAGWGHGVGLCQIGAAVMGAQGYKYKDILLHYYIGASIEKEY